jgi:F-box/leucine-rich repeat protein 2/20
MHAIGQHCKHLRKLELACCDQVTDTGLSAVAAGCPRLTLFASDMQLSDTALLALAEHCQDLRTVVLNCSWASSLPVTDVGINALVANCCKLRKLSLSKAGVTEAIVPVIAAHCKLLRELYFQDCQQVRLGKVPVGELFDAEVWVGIA